MNPVMSIEATLQLSERPPEGAPDLNGVALVHESDLNGGSRSSPPGKEDHLHPQFS